MSDSVTLPPKARRGYWKILAYSLASIALVVGLFQLYLWNLDRQEWAAIEALLAEQDLIRPGWRWQEYQPEASKLGDKNGALRFIEVGKKITEKMLETPVVPSEEYVDYPQDSKQGLTTLERESILLDLKITRDQCQHLDEHLPQLMNYMPGSPLWSARKPPAYLFLGLGKSDEKYVDPDLEAFHRCESWLYRLQNYHRQSNNGEQAGRAWLAELMLCFNSPPGIINTPKLRGQQSAFDCSMNWCHRQK